MYQLMLFAWSWDSHLLGTAATTLMMTDQLVVEEKLKKHNLPQI